MTVVRVLALADGGPLDGAVLPATRVTDEFAIVDVHDKDRPGEKVHLYQAVTGERTARYCGCFARTIDIPPTSQRDDDAADSTYGELP